MKTVIFGIDGMSLDVLKSFGGYLGLFNILKVVKEGLSTSIRTVIPPSSAPAWTSLFTGENPMQHGVFDFFNTKLLRNGVFSIDRKLSSYALWKKTLWSQASVKGKKSLVIGVPVIPCAHKMNGIYIAGGLLAPQIDERVVYPRRVYHLIQKSGYDNGFETMFDSIAKLASAKLLDDSSEITELIESFVSFERKKFNLLMKLRQESDFELIIFVTTAYDHLAHYFLHESDIAFSARLLKPYLVTLDEFAKYLLSELDQEDFLYIVSDHGMHSVSRVFLVNNWLRAKRLLKPNGYSTTSLEINGFVRSLASMLSKASKYLHLKKNFKNYMEKVIKAKQTGKNLAGLVDLERSVAYCLSYSSFGIFLKERKLMNGLKRELELLEDEENGRKVFDEIEISQRIPRVNKAPDIMLAPAKGYTINTMLPRYNGDILVNRDKALLKVADHTMDAVFVAYRKKKKPKLAIPQKITDLHQLFLSKLE